MASSEIKSQSISASEVETLKRTAAQQLAFEERMSYEAAAPEERAKFEHLADFIHAKYPERSKRAVAIRSKLHYAGERARIFWLRIEAGMALTTASNLLLECERAWHVRGGATKEEPTFDDLVRARFAKYDASGTLRTVGGKSYRATTQRGRAARIAKGEEGAEEKKQLSPNAHKAHVREAIAGWVAARLPKGDPRASAFTAEFMREIEAVLYTFTQRFTIAIPKRHELFLACDFLNVPRPRWGQPADQKRAWTNRRAALRATHPDTLGHEGGKDAYQQVNDAYALIVAYNDSLTTSSSSETSETTKASSDDGRSNREPNGES
jgi:hypothetical protein